MRVVGVKDMAQLPAGTVYADLDEKNTFTELHLEIKTGRDFGSLPLLPDYEYGLCMFGGEWDWDLKADYPECAKFVVLEDKDLDEILARLMAARFGSGKSLFGFDELYQYYHKKVKELHEKGEC